MFIRLSVTGSCEWLWLQQPVANLLPLSGLQPPAFVVHFKALPYAVASMPSAHRLLSRRVRVSPGGCLLAAWEVTPADQTQYWEQVPDHVKLALHYYNVPCSIEPDSEFNPLRIVKTLYQPGDFVVIKVGAHGRTIFAPDSIAVLHMLASSRRSDLHCLSHCWPKWV